MTLFDANHLLEYWSLHPPPCDMLQILAMQWGWKPSEEKKYGDLSELFAMFPNGTISAGPH